MPPKGMCVHVYVCMCICMCMCVWRGGRNELCILCLVGANHKYHSSAYVSEELTRAVHKMLKGHKKGIPLSEFAKQFKVSVPLPLM